MKIINILTSLLVIVLLISPNVSQANSTIPYLVKDINPGNSGLTDTLTRFPYQGKLWFMADDGVHFHNWWTSDGTSEGTQLSAIMEKMGSSFVLDSSTPTVMNNIAYFVAAQAASNQLWRTDGTVDGTWQVMNFDNGNGVYRFLGAYANWLYMFASLNGQYGIYKSNGNTNSMELVLPLACFADVKMQELGGKLLVTEGCSMLNLWKMDINGQNVTKVKDLGYKYGYGEMVKMANLVFINQDGIWQTDGTQSGTVQIIENSNIYSLTVMNGWLYYAIGGISQDHCIKRTQTGIEQTVICFTSLKADNINQIMVVGDRLYFVSAGNNSSLPQALWVTDGSAGGTMQLPSGNCGVGSRGIGFTFGKLAWFLSCDTEHGNELWTSDGTSKGTHIFADINPGVGSSYPTDFMLAGTKLFFSADDGIHGRELWAMDLIQSQVFLPLIIR